MTRTISVAFDEAITIARFKINEPACSVVWRIKGSGFGNLER